MIGTIQWIAILLGIELILYRIISKIFTKFETKLFRGPAGLINLDKMHRWTMFIVLWLNIAFIVGVGTYFICHQGPSPRVPLWSDLWDEVRFVDLYDGYKREYVVLVNMKRGDPENFSPNEQNKLRHIEKALKKLDAQPKHPTTKNMFTALFILASIFIPLFWYLTR